MPVSGSAWATNQVYLAQLALSDINAGTYHSDERFGRGAIGLAGVSSAPFRVWLDNWTVKADPGACGDCFAVDINAAASSFTLRLHLNNTRPMVILLLTCSGPLTGRRLLLPATTSPRRGM